MSLSKTLYPLLSTGSSLSYCKIVDWDVKNQNEQKTLFNIEATIACSLFFCCMPQLTIGVSSKDVTPHKSLPSDYCCNFFYMAR